jgi:hypothetical protein
MHLFVVEISFLSVYEFESPNLVYRGIYGISKTAALITGRFSSNKSIRGNGPGREGAAQIPAAEPRIGPRPLV